MAKKSLILSNNDGRVAFSNTSSLSIDDITNNISASHISANSIKLNNLPNNSIMLLSASNGNISIFPNGTINGGAIAFNGTNWVASNSLVQDYSGSAYGDITGKYENTVQVVNISNVNNGSLPVAFGGTGVNLSRTSGDILKISSSIDKNPVITGLSPQSGSILTSINNIWTSIPPGYPDVRFYTIGLNGNTFIWTKPAGARFARVMLQGAGGGGSSGHSYGFGIHQGGGGGSGGFSDVIIFLDESVIEVPVTVGIGGAGGPAKASDPSLSVWLQTGDTNTKPGVSTSYGTNGGSSSFGTYVYASGGQGGYTNGAVIPAYTAFGTVFNGVNCSNSNAGAAGFSNTNNSSGGGSGGGYSGGIVNVYGISSSNRNFGYNIDFNGNQINCNFGSGSTGAVWAGANTIKPPTPSAYGAGGGGGTALTNTGQSSGGDGSNGYALIVSW